MVNDVYEICRAVLDVFTPSQSKKALLLAPSLLAPGPMILLFTLDELWCSSEAVQLINRAKSQIIIFWASNGTGSVKSPASAGQCKGRWEAVPG